MDFPKRFSEPQGTLSEGSLAIRGRSLVGLQEFRRWQCKWQFLLRTACASVLVLGGLLNQGFAQSERPNVANFIVEVQPLERWIRLGATLLRDSGAGDEADALALQTRFIAAAIKVDTNRHAVVQGELQADDNGELILVPDSITALLPTPFIETRFNSQRIEFGEKFGVRQVEDDGSPLVDGEFYATAADKWAWIAKTKNTVGQDAHTTAIKQFSEPPDSLVRLQLLEPITESQRSAMIAKLWADVENDLVRKNDEPSNVFALRSEIQTAFAQLIENAVSDFDAITLAVDANDSFDLAGELRCRWSGDGTLGDAIANLKSAPSLFGHMTSDQCVMRLEIGLQLPRRTARRVGRWADTLGDVSQSVAKLANRPKLIPLISASQTSLAPAMSTGRVDAFIDLVRLEDSLSIQGAIAYPGLEILNVARPMIETKPERVVQTGQWTFLQIGEPGAEKRSPLGPRPTLWVTADEHAIYFVIGQQAAIPEFANRLSQTRVTSLADRNSGQSPTEPEAVLSTTVGDRLARLDIDGDELIAALRMLPDNKDVQRLADAFEGTIESTQSSMILTTSDGELVLTANLPGEVVLALTSAFVKAKKKQ